MRELEKYRGCIRSSDKEWKDGKYNLSNFSSIKDYYKVLVNDWSNLLETDIPETFQAIFSYVFLIYHDIDKINKLYAKFESVEIASYLLMFLTRKGEKEEIMSLIEKFKYRSKSENVCFFTRVDFFLWQAYFFIHQNQFDEAQEKISQSKELLNSKNTEIDPLHYIQQKASIFHVHGLLKERERVSREAIELYKKGIALLEDNNVNDKYLLGTLYNSLGNATWYIGDFKAKGIYETALKFFTDLNIERGQVICKGNLASLLMQEGRFNKAVEIMLDLKTYLEETEDTRNLLVIYETIYSCLKSLGRMGEAEYYLNKAFGLIEKTTLEYDEIYLDAAEFYSIKGETEEAQLYVKKYSQLFNISEHDEKSLRVGNLIIIKGFVELKRKNFYRSEELLRKGIRYAKELNVTPLMLQGYVYLIELLILKLKIEEQEYEKMKIINELEYLCQETVALLKTYKSIFQWVNYNLLLSSIYILTQKLSLALEILKRTKEICLEYNFISQLQKVESDINKLEKLVSVQEESHLPELDNLLVDYEYENSMLSYSEKGVQESTLLIELPNEPELLFLQIILASGLPCYSYNFSEEQFSDDEILLAGLINAIENFSSEVAVGGRGFRLLEHSEYYILLETLEDFTIALFTKQFTYSLKDKMLNFSQEVKQYIREYIDNSSMPINKREQLRTAIDKLVSANFLD